MSVTVHQKHSVDYSSLVATVEQKQLLEISGYGTGALTPLGRWGGLPFTRPLVRDISHIDWNAPCLDFGHRLDRYSKEFVGQRNYDHLLAEGQKRLHAGTLKLPHHNCAYLFHCVDDAEDYPRTYCNVSTLR